MTGAGGPVPVDSSVAVPLLATGHLSHGVVSTWAHGRTLVLSGHAAVETFSVLTRLPEDARVDPADAARLLAARFAETLVLRRERAVALPHLCAERGIHGGAVYDALVAFAALDHGLPLATRDARARDTYTRVGVRVLTVGAPR